MLSITTAILACKEISSNSFKNEINNLFTKKLYIYIYIYIYSLTSTTLSRRLIMHLSNTSSIAQHLKKHSCPTTELRKILTENATILKHQNNKQKLQILEALHIRKIQPKLNRTNFQTNANVLKCLWLLSLYRNEFKSKRYTRQWHRQSSSYKVVMYILSWWWPKVEQKVLGK